MDDIQKVYSWYTDKLNSESWNIQASGIQNGEITIVATKDGDTITVLASRVKDTYTKITVNYVYS